MQIDVVLLKMSGFSGEI